MKTHLTRFLSDYGMFVVLLLICAALSVLTYEEVHPKGEAAGEQLARIIQDRDAKSVLIVVTATEDGRAFAQALERRLEGKQIAVAGKAEGTPKDALTAIKSLVADGKSLDAIAVTDVTVKWLVFDGLAERFPELGNPVMLQPQSYKWPVFLKRDNLRNIGNQIAVIAIIAIGMTLVIITAGIDLSVGRLIAVASVGSTILIRDYGGGTEASAWMMILCCTAGILVCGLAGLFNGVMITVFKIPPFIVTLAMMMIAKGVADMWSENLSIIDIPDTFNWLGSGRDLFGIPNAVVLMLILYFMAHILMSRTTLGRYIYAVGGNPEAARLSGVPVKRILLIVYTLCGLLAGVGGVVLSSQLRSGNPNFGAMYELYVIAAVVVGGTSIAGGEGKVWGTLIGAFISGVMLNGMNLLGVDTNWQKIAFGFVILGAVLLDQCKKNPAMRAFFARVFPSS